MEECLKCVNEECAALMLHLRSWR